MLIDGKHTPTAVIAKKAILLSPDISTPNYGCIWKFLLNSQFGVVLQDIQKTMHYSKISSIPKMVSFILKLNNYSHIRT